MVDFPEGLSVRHPTGDDHPRVLAVLDLWWGSLGGPEGSRQRAQLLPRLFFQHFSDSSLLVERSVSDLTAFLIGFVSPARPEVAYVHFLGVDPKARREGIATRLYQSFFDIAIERGAWVAKAITSPANSTSVAFHRSVGFDIDPSDTFERGVPVHLDYDGPGRHRVTFTRQLR